MKYIVLSFYFFCQFVYAANVTEPIVATSLAKFYFGGNLALSGTGIRVPTHSNYFAFHDGRIFMTHVEKSSERLREISFVDNKFVVSSVDKIPPFKMEFTKNLVNDINKEKIYRKNVFNCPAGIKMHYAQSIIIIPGLGNIHYSEYDIDGASFAIQFLKCADEYIVIGSLKCFSSGYCEQQIHGTKLPKSSDFTAKNYFSFFANETVKSYTQGIVLHKIKETFKPFYLNNNFKIAINDANKFCQQFEPEQNDEVAQALSNLGWNIKQSIKIGKFQVVDVFASAYLPEGGRFCYYGNIYSFVFKDGRIKSVANKRGLGFYTYNDTLNGDMNPTFRVFESEHINYFDVRRDTKVCPEKYKLPSLYQLSFEEAADALYSKGDFTRENSERNSLAQPDYCDKANFYCSYVFKNSAGTRVRLNTQGIGERKVLESTDIICKDVET